MFKFFFPGLQYYVKQIETGPFSMVKYGDGEWKAMVPEIPLFPKQQIVFSEEAECDVLRHTVIDCYRNDRYLMATCHQTGIRKMGHSKTLRSWIRQHVPGWVQWHDGHEFRRAARDGILYPLVEAIWSQPLPIVMVGPECLSNLGLPIDGHVVTADEEEWPTAWYERAKTEEEILAFGRPAFFSFSVGTAAKVMIHDLWPELGTHSYLVDFGALWEGLCGNKIRRYHNALSPKVIRMNLYGDGIPAPKVR